MFMRGFVSLVEKVGERTVVTMVMFVISLIMGVILFNLVADMIESTFQTMNESIFSIGSESDLSRFIQDNPFGKKSTGWGQ